MAKKVKQVIECVTVRYDLFDLPAAQHKAGLAGLILQIHFLQRKELKIPAEEIPTIEELTPTSCTIRFTQSSVQRLFDEVYDATLEETRVKSRWANADLVREEEIEEADGEGKTKMTRWFVYQVVQPRGRFLRQHLPQMNAARDWHKLWRDMLWQIPRGSPPSRIPFEQRAAGQPCAEGQKAWDDLVRFEQARTKGQRRTGDVAGSLWLGAQAINAESVPFVGCVEQTLLLHFWPLTVLVFAPQRIDNDGASEYVGYALAIPEVANLKSFCSCYPELLRSLPDEERGYRPAGAVIDLPAQAALELLESLNALAQRKVEQQSLESISAVEFVHLVKIGNNVKSQTTGRIVPRPDLLDRYLAIAGTPCQQTFRNPLFRAGMLLSLLRSQRTPTEWYECLAPLVMERPWPFFIRSADSPRALPWFWTDAAKQFENEQIEFDQQQENHRVNASDDPSAKGPAPNLPLLIHRLVRTYIWRRTEDRSELTWDKVKDDKKIDAEGRERPGEDLQAYQKAREKVASDLFLGMRSRRDDDFVRFFTDSVCYYKQFLSEEDFRVVACALLTQPENVKTIAMLSTSANS